MINRLYKAFFFIIALSLSSTDIYAQDPEFTQFYANPLYLNPAFAGTSHCPRVSLSFRNQWPGIGATYVTSSASFDTHVDAISGGLGVLAWNDRAGEGGVLVTTNVSGVYSYQIPVNKKFSLKVGVQGTWAQKKLDWSKLVFGDQIDARRGFIYNTQEPQSNAPASYVDFSAGILGFSENYFFGVAVNHLTEPNESVIQGASALPRKYTFHAGGIIPLDKSEGGAAISPNVLVQLQQNFLQVNLGVYLSKGPIVGGLWHRTNIGNPDSFIALVGFQAGLMKFGYSYDYTVSKLENGVTGGSHEVSVGFQFDCQPKQKKFRTVNCPSF